MQKEGCVYTTLSDAIVKRMVGSTMAGAKAAAKMAATKGAPKLGAAESQLAMDSDFVISSPLGNPSVLAKSSHRFRVGDDAFLGDITKGFQLSNKASFDNQRKDDGSNWIVGGGMPAGSVPFVVQRRRSLCQTGSSWGGGGSLLEPISQGKLLLDQPFKMTLPKFDSPWASFAR